MIVAFGDAYRIPAAPHVSKTAPQDIALPSTIVATGTRDVLIASAALLLPMGLGLYCGNRLHGRLSRAQAVRIVGGLLVLSGVTLLLRAVGELQ